MRFKGTYTDFIADIERKAKYNDIDTEIYEHLLKEVADID